MDIWLFKAWDFGLPFFPGYHSTLCMQLTTFTHLSHRTLFAIHDYHVLIFFRLDHFWISLRLMTTLGLYEHLTNIFTNGARFYR